MALPLDTPVGAEIVCVDASYLRCCMTGRLTGPSGFVEKRVYTLGGWAIAMSNEPCVVLAEPCHPFAGGYNPARFRRLHLGGLDALLTTQQPIDA